MDNVESTIIGHVHWMRPQLKLLELEMRTTLRHIRRQILNEMRFMDWALQGPLAGGGFLWVAGTKWTWCFFSTVWRLSFVTQEDKSFPTKYLPHRGRVDIVEAGAMREDLSLAIEISFSLIQIETDSLWRYHIFWLEKLRTSRKCVFSLLI